MIYRRVYRILDANLNRAQEGLRVCEELARFILDDRLLTQRLRRLRHAIVTAAGKLPVSRVALVAARNSQHDVGRGTGDGGRRHTPAHTALANLSRAKESLRVLEEYAKLLSPQAAASFARLRFRAYATEQALLQRLAAVRHPRSRRRARV